MDFRERANVKIIIPLRAAELLTQRCEAGETHDGYRFGLVDGNCVFYRAGQEEPAGSWRLRAYEPRETQCTILRLLWNPEHATESAVCSAIAAGSGAQVFDSDLGANWGPRW